MPASTADQTSSEATKAIIYASFCSARAPCHSMRYHWPPSHAVGWCVRDHWQVSLVEAGQAQFHVVDDHGTERQRLLEPGDCRIVPARRVHRIEAWDADGVTESHLFFPTTIVAGVAELLAEDRPRFFPWRTSGMPRHWRLQPIAAQRFIDLVDDSSMRHLQRHDAIMALCRCLQLRQQAPPSPYADLPAWLRHGLIRLRQPTALQEGVHALVHLTGRSRDHINRVVRRHRGCTSTELINQLRVEMAAAHLRLTDRSIADIAELVGLPDPSHFYKTFRRLQGCTPRQCRHGGEKHGGPLPTTPG